MFAATIVFRLIGRAMCDTVRSTRTSHAEEIDLAAVPYKYMYDDDNQIPDDNHSERFRSAVLLATRPPSTESVSTPCPFGSSRDPSLL